MKATISTQAENLDHGWHAQLELVFQKKIIKTVLSNCRRQGPLTVQRAFYPKDNVCHVYILHPPGGVVGGDRLDIDLELKKDSHTLLTTPGATKFYLSEGKTAIQNQVFNVADGAILEWLPQENIFFPGAIVNSSLQLNLHGSARVAIWEIQCLGRPAINETFDSGTLDNHWQLYRNHQPILIERLRINKDKLHILSQLNSCPITATFIISNATGKLLESLRHYHFSDKSGTLAMTLIEDLLIIRYLGHSTEQARRCFVKIWSQVRPACLGTRVVIPRIWNT